MQDVLYKKLFIDLYLYDAAILFCKNYPKIIYYLSIVSYNR